jgi:hypothetical protein
VTDGLTVEARVGDTVRAGLTVLARIAPPQEQHS